MKSPTLALSEEVQEVIERDGQSEDLRGLVAVRGGVPPETVKRRWAHLGLSRDGVSLSSPP